MVAFSWNTHTGDPEDFDGMRSRERKLRWKMLVGIKKFLRDESGMEMVEWTIVAIVFAVAAAVFWENMAGAINTAIERITTELESV